MASATIPYNDTTVIWGRVKKTIADSTAYLGISQFDANTYYEFGLYIDSMNSCRNIIFDLRDNTGGSLSAVDSIIQSILPHNTAYIKERYRDYNYTNLTASTVDWQTQKTSYSNLQYGAIASGKRIVVLTNRYTASAAELMAAALKDGLNATLVGDTSYGKGMGQVIIPRQIWGKTNVKITFLLIQGVSNRTGNYHRKGIVPDTLRPSYFYTNNSAQINAAYDNQFLAAVRVFNPSATLAKIRSQESVTMPAMARRPILHSTPEAYYIVSPDKLPVRQ
jgi:C-terminal processing protease CtpA/Prc